MTALRLPERSSVNTLVKNDIPDGDRKTTNLFYSVGTESHEYINPPSPPPPKKTVYFKGIRFLSKLLFPFPLVTAKKIGDYFDIYNAKSITATH
jgi:hypothetical protein